MTEKQADFWTPIQLIWSGTGFFFILIYSPVITAGLITNGVTRHEEISRLIVTASLQAILALIELLGTVCCCIGGAVVYQYALRSWPWWQRMTIFVSLGIFFNTTNGLIVAYCTEEKLSKLAILNITGSIMHYSVFDAVMQMRTSSKIDKANGHSEDHKKNDCIREEEQHYEPNIEPTLMF